MKKAEDFTRENELFKREIRKLEGTIEVLQHSYSHPKENVLPSKWSVMSWRSGLQNYRR